MQDFSYYATVCGIVKEHDLTSCSWSSLAAQQHCCHEGQKPLVLAEADLILSLRLLSRTHNVQRCYCCSVIVNLSVSFSLMSPFSL